MFNSVTFGIRVTSAPGGGVVDVRAVRDFKKSFTAPRVPARRNAIDLEVEELKALTDLMACTQDNELFAALQERYFLLWSRTMIDNEYMKPRARRAAVSRIRKQCSGTAL